MPALANPRYEMFAQCLARGLTQVESAAKAGFSNAGGNACTTAKRPEIIARVQELQQERLNELDTGSTTIFSGSAADVEHQEAMERALQTGSIDRGWIVAQLLENARLARQVSQFAASNAALIALGKEIGMFQENSGEKNKKKDEDKKKEEEKKAASISVDALNKILTQLNYTGPPIDLTDQPDPTVKRGPGRPRTKALPNAANNAS